MKTLSIILVVIALLIFIGGMTSATGAPQEAALAGICCFLGILARMAQAEAHHSAQSASKVQEKISQAPPPPEAYRKTGLSDI